jgi:hypothetical protein
MVARGLSAAVVAIVLGWDVCPAEATERECADTVREEAKPEAADLMAQGKKEFEAGHYEEALRLFEKAYCVAPVPVIHHPLSAAALKLGRCDEALHDAEIWNRNVTPKDRDEARSWLREVQKQCVEVEIFSEPSGASVRVDGSQRSPLITPWRGLLPTGPHSISATEERSLPQTEEITVPRGRGTPFRVALKLQPRPLPVVVAPPPAAASSKVVPAQKHLPPTSTAPSNLAVAVKESAPAKPLTPPKKNAAQSLPPAVIHAEDVPEGSRPMSFGRTIGVSLAAIGGAALLSAVVLGPVTAIQQNNLHSTRQAGASAEMQLQANNRMGSAFYALLGGGALLAIPGTGVAIVF